MPITHLVFAAGTPVVPPQDLASRPRRNRRSATVREAFREVRRVTRSDIIAKSRIAACSFAILSRILSTSKSDCNLLFADNFVSIKLYLSHLRS